MTATLVTSDGTRLGFTTRSGKPGVVEVTVDGRPAGCVYSAELDRAWRASGAD